MRFFAMSVLSARALSTTPTKPFVVAVDGVAERTALTSKEWLTAGPSGAYTTARTCANGARLFEWDMHVARTAESVASMVAAAPSAAGAAAVAAAGTAAALRPRLEASVRAAVDAFRADSDADELKVTVLVSWDERTAVAAHVAPLPPPPARPVRVEARGAPRSNAAAKDSSWVRERAPLEALMAASAVGPVNELLLLEDGRYALEGSQTNFFAVEDGALVTAGDGVLFGTVRRLALEVCAREGVPVEFRAPDVEAAGTWDGALVSSTSRLLLPVDELYAPAEGEPSRPGDLLRAFDNGDGALAAKLAALVAAEVEAHSSPVAAFPAAAS